MYQLTLFFNLHPQYVNKFDTGTNTLKHQIFGLDSTSTVKTILTVQTIFRLKYITLFEALLPSPHGMCYILTSLISRTNYLESLTLKNIGNDKGVFFHLHPNLSSYSRQKLWDVNKEKYWSFQMIFSCLVPKIIDGRN